MNCYAVLRDGYFLNLLLHIDRCHDLHHLHHVVTPGLPNMSIAWQSSSPISAGEETKKCLLNQAETLPEACYTGQEERFNHFALISAAKLSSDSRRVAKYPNNVPKRELFIFQRDPSRSLEEEKKQMYEEIGERLPTALPLLLRMRRVGFEYFHWVRFALAE